MEAIVSLLVTLLVACIAIGAVLLAGAWVTARLLPGRRLREPSSGEKEKALRHVRASLPGIHSIGFLGRWGK